MFPPGKITRHKFPEVSTNAEKISHGQRGATAGSHDMQKSALHRCRRPAGLFWPRIIISEMSFRRKKKLRETVEK